MLFDPKALLSGCFKDKYVAKVKARLYQLAWTAILFL